MLAAGDGQCALRLLERRDPDVWQEQQLIEHWGAGPNGMIDIGFTDLTRLRQTLQSSLAGLPQNCESGSPDDYSRPTG
ncbi:hypothetical protein SBA6_970013 [Candidatus Sulfopaludibacter sp. SbA6]|nr:hypothetical protein SBA6_970013 [Candidatus Sulfopaludibacter sp. SbA6]